MYNVKLSYQNIHLVARALELFSRISAGQFWYVSLCHTIEKRSWDLSEINRGHFEAYLSLAAQLITGFERGGSFGIFNPALEQEARVAYHIERSIRHQLWQDSPDKWINASSAYPADIVKDLVVPVSGLSREDMAHELFAIHSHAQLVYEENPEQIVYKETDVIALLERLGFPTPDWEAWGNTAAGDKDHHNEGLQEIGEIGKDQEEEKWDGSKWTMEDIRRYNITAGSPGPPDEWYVHLWMGYNDNGLRISEAYKTEEEANKAADKIAKYIAPLFLRD